MRPSQVALAKRIQQFISQLHPPSPPTAQETKTLLGLLNASFQKELDAAHPKPGTSRYSGDDDAQIPVPEDHTARSATYSHWTRLSKMITPDSLQAQPSQPKPAIVKSLEEALDEVEASHSISSLGLLLSTYNTQSAIAKISGSMQKDALRAARAFFSRLDKWLLSTQPDLRMAFFTSPHFITATNLLVHSYQENILWQWLAMVYARKLVSAPASSLSWLRVEDILISSLIRYSLQRGMVFEAVQQYMHASQYQLQTGRPVSDPKFVNMSSWLLTASIMRTRRSHNLDADAYDTMLNNLSFVRGDAQVCRIYHPTSPSAKELADCLSSDQNKAKLLHRHISAKSAAKQKVTIVALLDAAELSIVQGRSADARFLLNFVKQRCLEPPSALTQTTATSSQLSTQIDSLREVINSGLSRLAAGNPRATALAVG